MGETTIEKLNVLDLPLIPFLRAVRDNDPSIIHQDADEDVLFDLMIDYNDAIRGGVKNIEKRKNHYESVKMICLNSICLVNRNEVGFVIKSMSEFGIKLFSKDKEGLINELNYIISKNQDSLDIYSSMYDNMNKMKKKPEFSENNIYKNLASLSSSMNMSINFNSITVGEYVGYYQINKENSSKLKTSNKNGKRRSYRG